MTLHVHGTLVTQYGIAANNRGENEGNITTLQKILWKGFNHTTVSAEAIRYALRLHWQLQHEETGDEILAINRVWNPEKGDAGDYEFQDQAFSAERYIDDDVMGYMDAKAAKADNSDGEEGKGNKRARGSTTARRGPLEVTRAVSLDPYNGETTFNAKGGKKGGTSLYATEVHATRYQYSFSLTPSALKAPQRAMHVVNALCALTEVGGNHGRFLYDFSPTLAIFRLSQDPAPRILYVGQSMHDGQEFTLATLIQRIDAGDIDASELIIGGELLSENEVKRLKELGATVFRGVKKAADQVTAQLGR